MKAITDSQGRKVGLRRVSRQSVIPRSTLFCTEYNHLLHKQSRCVSFCLSSLLAYTLSPLGSDILAHASASDSSGAVTPDARTEVMERIKEEFSPELQNRLDSMFAFNWLARESILCVLDLREDVAAHLVHWRIKLGVDDAACGWLAQKGFSDPYGARAIVHVVCTEVLFPAGAETASRYDMVSFYACVLWVRLLMLGSLSFFSASDGDMAESADGIFVIIIS